MTNHNIKLSGAIAALGVSAALLVSISAWAWEDYAGTSYFLDGISAESSWNEILAKPGMKAVFPQINFGPTYVSLSNVCVNGDTVAIADTRGGTGLRIPADGLRAQVEAATAGHTYGANAGGPLAAAGPVEPATNVAVRYPVKVYRVIDEGQWQHWIYAFDKLWPIPTCPGK